MGQGESEERKKVAKMKRLLIATFIGASLLAIPGTAAHNTKCETCVRNKKGKIKRSETATRDFRKSSPCPSTGKTSGACKGYVIDHVKPLKEGGADEPSNMQWQTVAAAKAKDRTE
jgi:hypothetical protein